MDVDLQQVQAVAPAVRQVLHALAVAVAVATAAVRVAVRVAAASAAAPVAVAVAAASAVAPAAVAAASADHLQVVLQADVVAQVDEGSDPHSVEHDVGAATPRSSSQRR